MVESSQSEAQVPHQETAHETTDANIGGVVAAGGALFILLAVVLFVLKGLFDFYFAREAEKKQAPSPSVMREPRRPPPEPRLEGLEDLEATDPQLLAFRAASQLGFSTGMVPGKTPAGTAAAAAIMALFLQPPTVRKSPVQELEALKDYGWVDREAGIVRIPIDAAMDILANQLPVRPGQVDEDERVNEPRSSNSGRTHRRREP